MPPKLGSTSLATAWIRPLAAPYLRGFTALPERGSSLAGNWFLAAGSAPSVARRSAGRAPRAPQSARGFFVGYLLAGEGYEFLSPEPPECLVFAFVRPVGGAVHRQLVRRPDSLLRWTSEYIRWLTHRPPRFAFFEDQPVALVRHRSMRDWPCEKHEHYSRNFFVETLAWLVRSALVRRLYAEPSPDMIFPALPGRRAV